LDFPTADLYPFIMYASMLICFERFYFDVVVSIK
jgi:hypothetical protein